MKSAHRTTGRRILGSFGKLPGSVARLSALLPMPLGNIGRPSHPLRDLITVGKAKVHTFRFLLSSLLLTALLVPGLIPGLAQAQGAGAEDDIAGPVRIDRSVVVGGYRLYVEAEASSLSLGSALVSIAVLNALTEEPIPDAAVIIHTRHQESGETGWARALEVPDHPEIYRSRMKLELPGQWDLSVEVDGPLGRVETTPGTLTIPEPRQYWVGSLVFAGVSVILFCGVGYAVWTIRRTQSRRETANAA